MKMEAVGNHGRVLITKINEGWLLQRRMELHSPNNATNDGYAAFTLQSHIISDIDHELDPKSFLFYDEVPQ